MPYTIRGTVTCHNNSECKSDVVVDTHEEALRFIQANMYTIYANMFESETYATYSMWNGMDSIPIRWSNRQSIEKLLTETEPADGKMTVYFGSAHNEGKLWCFGVERT